MLAVRKPCHPDLEREEEEPIELAREKELIERSSSSAPPPKDGSGA
jgi:hypothetical protein